MFKKILIANRGEIAIRVMRAANELGKKTVAVYAKEDKLSLHRFKADEAYQLSEKLGPVGSYLSINEIIRIAKMSKADAIHPGYGLLSENPQLVEACENENITFIGPSAKIMRDLGNKSKARKIAHSLGVPVLPASENLTGNKLKIERIAKQIGFPLMLKASWGGGGRGMRPINHMNELHSKIKEGKRESSSSFGNDESYFEKLIINARHVEVQILGDKNGKIFHLFERDCSIQRRNQKVIERAPAPYLSEMQRKELCEYALKICSHVKYFCAGTVEFLMDVETSKFYFIEVNPRIQVEHTVSEEVTGIDIVRAQILLAENNTIETATGKISQDGIYLNGHAIQCRITSEDPQNNFIPDYGRITAYRAATGMGIRLDGGTAYSGAIITRYYDSLLEKITSWAPTSTEAVSRMDRALREFRIRGISTNISFLENLLKHETFIKSQYTTSFIDNTHDLFDFDKRKDRATKLLTYIAEISVNGHDEVKMNSSYTKDVSIPLVLEKKLKKNCYDIFNERGSKGLSNWILDQKKVLITDTTMRDGHQSLIATRMRTFDMIKIAESYSKNLNQLFSLECWGGATFDVAYRFLHECPWERLRMLKAKIPNILFQMLFRGSNAVGYKNYPDNVVEGFVKRASKSGIDIFRIFDSLNWVENMKVAMNSVLENEKILEASICYTGDILNKKNKKYNLEYYLKMAEELKKFGAHIIGLKDMAGLLKPEAAKLLVKSLKEEINLPIHFHTHDTSGMGSATILAASEAGVDIVDLAMDSFSGGTSQPCLGSVINALNDTIRKTDINLTDVQRVNSYWDQVRPNYNYFEAGLASPASEVYQHEMPGGQFTNLKAQAKSLGLENRWEEIAHNYSEVNQMFGDIIKVTPSSKVVGDMALLMVTQGLSREDVENPDLEVTFPKSVIQMLSGDLGQPPGGFPKKILKKVLRNSKFNTSRPGSIIPSVDLKEIKIEAKEKCFNQELSEEEVYSYLMYPDVFIEYIRKRELYGPLTCLPTSVFFNGMVIGQEISAEISPGKTLEIRLQAFGDTNEIGEIKVFFEINGQPRVIKIIDKSVKIEKQHHPKANENDPNHVGSPMPGLISSINVEVKQKVKKGDLLLTIEAMKMETGIYAEKNGIISDVLFKQGSQIDAKDLLLKFE